jgi:hypothetical protein
MALSVSRFCMGWQEPVLHYLAFGEFEHGKKAG